MMMFQESALFPWLDAFGNVMFSLKRKPGLSDTERREVAEYYLKLVGLEKFMHASIHELSGGMKQRVALARALAPNPRVLLMDEPFAALDEITRQKLNADLLDWWAQRRLAVMFVTHSVYEAVFLSQRVVVMSARPGRVIADLRIDVPYPRSAAFRTSTEFAALCRTASEALAAAHPA
jgi:NitT/TauT family transport system ATP-binding protein